MLGEVDGWVTLGAICERKMFFKRNSPKAILPSAKFSTFFYLTDFLS